MPRVVISFRWTVGALLGFSWVCAAAMGQDAGVAGLAEQLKSSDSAVQIEAAQMLGTLGASAGSAVPALLDSLNSPDAEVRAAVALACAGIKPEGEAAVQRLIERLSDDSPRVRATAAYALGQIGNTEQATVEALIQAALDSDVVVRREVRDALRTINAPREMTLSLWAKTLEDADPQVVIPAMMTLAELGKDAVPSLREALRNESTAYWAAHVATDLGPEAAELTPDLVEVLKHEDPECRMQALVALGEIGDPAKSAVPAIIELLETDSFDSVKYAAAYALGEIADPDEVVPELMKLLESEDLGLRAISARGLVKASPDPAVQERASKVLFEALKSDDPHIRQLTIRTLADRQPPAEGPRPELIEALAEAMNDAEPEVVSEVISALASKGKAAIPGVIRGLEIDDSRPYAVRIAALIGPDAQAAVPALIKAWQASTEDPMLQTEIHYAIGAIGADAAAAVPVLTAALASDVEPVRNSACYALGKIGPAAKSAVPALRKLLDSGEEFQRVASVWALLKIMPEDASIQYVAVPLLMGALQDTRPELVTEAIRSLGDIGKLAKPAVPLLRRALEDDRVHVRDAAKEALEKIGS